MVEGILDFGMAGLRKGLRLTGLQENFTELTQKAKNEFQKSDVPKSLQISKPTESVKPTEPVKISEKDSKNQKNSAKLIKTPHVASEEKYEQTQSSSESDESVWINPLTKESPSFDGHILLEKTPDSLPKTSMADMQKAKENLGSSDYEKKQSIKDIPQITEDILLTGDSPDPEYEEPQDFASTIAKLRTLLQQKSSESGFTTPALSPMPQDEIAKTPIEPPPTDLTKVDGAMPSLYKFCARTATGVFQNTLNTIKTALPGNINESNQCVVGNMEDWTFIEADSTSDDFYSRMKKLLSERRAFCTVDTAYEAIDSLEVIDQPDTSWVAASPPQFDDELDEFDLQVPITKALVDIICELISDTNTCLLQESVIKTLLLLIGNYSEEILVKHSDGLLHNVNKHVGKLPENINQDVLAMKLNEMVKICMGLFPGPAKKLLGESTIETGVRLFITSLQSQRINQDIFMQMFELFASELINACGQVSPAYSA
ncbi:hypothetical protein ILUMI_05405 [Ignelater luminosus]|uniref:Uncharacterized protein n=1 Tax=Ignelater luminosus TaxID=2038154 RepID=A0A8K0DHR1_IGNLU|nr:hypothetical protein ILUMI_05405 [Ignelater luminosus]